MRRVLLQACLAALWTVLAVSPCMADEIWAEVDGHEVSVYHLGAYYNCCWVLDADLQIEGGVIDLLEIEGEGSMYCYCFCYFDLAFNFEVEESGDYLLRVWYLDTVSDPWEYILMAELPILIDEGGAQNALIWSEQSECGGWATDAPPPDLLVAPGSWGLIKSLYH